jgi:simple sugar transport system ATP-binding protein
MREAAHGVLDTLDIDLPRRKLRDPVRNLSGGQRQAVAIGRAIYWKAELLIMDEPTAALGVPEQRKVRELILGLKRQQVAVIFISHNLQDIFAVADRILVLRRG